VLSNVKIGARLGFSFSALLILLIIIAGLALVRMTNIFDAIRKFVDEEHYVFWLVYLRNWMKLIH